MTAAVKQIEERLAELGRSDAEVVGDPLLCELLDPLRGRRPVHVVCGRPGCRQAISWWGLPSQGEPLPFAPRPTDVEGGGQIPWVSFDVPETRPETGYVYGVGPWIVEGARVIYCAEGPKPQFPKPKKEPPGKPRFEPLTPPAPYNSWSVMWLQTHDNPRDADPTEQGLRLTFRCKKCGYERTLSNTTMLKMLVAALASADGQKVTMRLV